VPDYFVTWTETDIRSTYVEAPDLEGAKLAAQRVILEEGELGSFVETISSDAIVVTDQDGSFHDA